MRFVAGAVFLSVWSLSAAEADSSARSRRSSSLVTPSQQRVALVSPKSELRNAVINRGGAKTKDAVISNKDVIVRTTVTTLLTTLGLMGLLYVGEHPTKFLIDTFGFPDKIFGIAPPLYVAFLVLSFGSGLVTQLVSGGLSSVAANQVLMPTETPDGPMSEWYASLKKPSWNPPGWLFPIMWLIVSKPTQFLALRQIHLATTVTNVVDGETVVTTVDSVRNWIALGVYCYHLAMGNTWNEVFFGYQKVGLGLVVIAKFWISLILSTVLFYREKDWAGYLLLPTCAWVTVATLLNWSIYKLNKDSASTPVARATKALPTKPKSEVKAIGSPTIPNGVVLAAATAIAMSAKFFFRQNE